MSDYDYNNGWLAIYIKKLYLKAKRKNYKKIQIFHHAKIIIFPPKKNSPPKKKKTKTLQENIIWI
jgi:hypothetical protein